MASSTPTLLGPPGIYQQPAAGRGGATAKQASEYESDPFVDLMVANFNKKTKFLGPPMGFTENNSPTFLSSGNPCLDFFFHVVPDTPPETVSQRLQLAWGQDPLKALKLVCNLRGVRGTGKSDKEGYYAAALWIHKHHPKTLAANVASLAEFGYFKDLPEILFRLLEGPDARKLASQAWQKRKASFESVTRCGGSFRGRGGSFRGRGSRFAGRGRIRFSGLEKTDRTDPKLTSQQKKIEKGKTGPGEGRIGCWGLDQTDRKLTREEKKIEKAKKVVERFNRNPDFKFLHDRVSDLFAQCLRSDMKLLNSSDVYKISLASKWCPSIDSSFDRSTLLCETIAKKVFPREEYPEYEGVEDAHYAYRVRDRLRKEVLVPLHKALELPEVFIGANDWGSIPYNRVASVAMKFYKGKFFKHDKERFEEYLEKVKSGESKIAAGALLPHEIIAALDDEDGGQVAELQWRRMVDDMAKNGKLNNCLAICDVSGSMNGIPMEVSVALGVLVSELSEEPWKGKLITFSADPKLQSVEGDSLLKKTEFVRRMEWGMNTDFQKVFDLLLEVAVNGKLRGDQMIKRLFVFSDMEFDQASSCYSNSYYPWEGSRRTGSWETDYQAIVRKFGEKGYGDYVPEIVFWNLRDSKATPVPGNQPGVALVSGFSKNLMKLFLEDCGALNPEAVMDAAISGIEYQNLVVLD